MADYQIVADIVINATGANSALSGLNRQVGILQHSLAGVKTILAAFVGGYGLASLTSELLRVNSAMQDTTIGLAGTLTALSGTGNFGAGLARARELMKGLRVDAREGVGSLEDYAMGIQRIAGAAGGSASDQQLRMLTKEFIAAGEAMKPGAGRWEGPQDVVQALTSGVNQTRTPIIEAALTAIHMTDTEFKALDPKGKIEALIRAGGTFGPAIKAMGQTWTAQMDTLRDNIQSVFRTAGGPLFDRWTKDLQAVNKWIDKNRDSIDAFLSNQGKRLVWLWDTLLSRSKEIALTMGAIGVAKGVAGAVGGGMGMLTGAGAATTAAGVAVAGVPAWATLLGTIGIVSSVLPAIAELFAALGISFVAIKTALADFPKLARVFYGLLGDLGEQIDLLGSNFSQLGSDLWQLIQGPLGYFLDALGSVLVAQLILAIGALDGLAWALNYVLEVIHNGLVKSGLIAAPAKVNPAQAISQGLVNYQNAQGLIGSVAAMNKAALIANNVNNFSGPITIQVKTEINEDPTRIAVAMDEVLRNLDRFRTQARRPIRPGGF